MTLRKALLSLVVVLGCSSTDDVPSDEGSTSSGANVDSSSGSGSDTGPAATGSTGSTGSTGATDDDGETGGPDEGMFACGLSADCDTIVYALDPPSGPATVCAAELIVSGEGGVLLGDSSEGNAEETLVVVPGDGTVLLQTRAMLGGDPWEYESVMQCDVAGLPALTDACAADSDDCTWFPWNVGSVPTVENCEEIDEPTCEELTDAAS